MKKRNSEKELGLLSGAMLGRGLDKGPSDWWGGVGNGGGTEEELPQRQVVCTKEQSGCGLVGQVLVRVWAGWLVSQSCPTRWPEEVLP